MDCLNLEVGKAYEFDHVRKGRFRGRLLSVGGGYVLVSLLDSVEGMSEDWESGQEMRMNELLIRSARELS